MINSHIEDYQATQFGQSIGNQGVSIFSVLPPFHNSTPANPAAYARLLNELIALRDNLATSEKGFTGTLQQVNAHHRTGAVNLIHYLGLRRQDIRPLQSPNQFEIVKIENLKTEVQQGNNEVNVPIEVS
ncbi:MAG: hypothetical protein Q8R23_06495 [Methylotenera sp.]|nr:hypothetical protein [Methylotenera sp.]